MQDVALDATNKVELKEFQSMENDICHARLCIRCKWPMDLMCSKCKIHCFSHKLWKISELWNFGKFLKFGNFLNFFFFVQICFFKEFFLTKLFFLTIFFKEFFLLSRPLHCIKVICKETVYFT